ncbi:MAG TPA: flagellar export chaperone FliS [Candidatus Wunengus sp. YC61]|uniref:flagellar export chaperone FliS n=1 Tax=Candidatus Wunengus sp. YC61 TaxID=3367698 RepID=UPI0040295F2A
MIATKKISNAYLEQEIMTLNPVQLLIKAYDAGITACNRKDESKASTVLVELIDSLNFDYAEIANSLFRLYDYCMREIKRGNFDVTLKVLKELRETWLQVQGSVQTEAFQTSSL